MTPDDISAAPDAADTAPASPAPDTSAAPSTAPSTTTPAVTAEADTGQTQSKESLLDAVLKVVPATNEKDVLAKPEDAPPPDGEKPDIEGQADTEHEDGPDDDEEVSKDLPKEVRRRISKLLNQRRELNREVTVLRPQAEIGVELESFAKSHDLSGQDIANTLQIAAMLRHGDYQAFYEAIKPFVRTAQEYLGVALPRDLSEQVRAGQMTEQAAKMFARQRFDGQRSQFELQATQTAQAHERVKSVQSEVQQAVTNFELRLSASDPDYKAKAPSVRRAAQALLYERGGSISSVKEALEITKAAYDEVSKQMRSLQPTPRATQPMPNGHAPTPSVRAAPKSLYEAALQGLENARRTGG